MLKYLAILVILGGSAMAQNENTALGSEALKRAFGDRFTEGQFQIFMGASKVSVGDQILQSILDENKREGWDEISEEEYRVLRSSVVTLGAAGNFQVGSDAVYDIEFFGPVDDRETALDGGTRTLLREDWRFILPSGKTYYRTRYMTRAPAPQGH